MENPFRSALRRMERTGSGFQLWISGIALKMTVIYRPILFFCDGESVLISIRRHVDQHQKEKKMPRSVKVRAIYIPIKSGHTDGVKKREQPYIPHPCVSWNQCLCYPSGKSFGGQSGCFFLCVVVEKNDQGGTSFGLEWKMPKSTKYFFE